MAYELQERYSALVLAKMRAELLLKDDVIFNNEYEGTPTAGAVKIPNRDQEVTARNYNKASGLAPETGEGSFETLVINQDVGVNEIIDGHDAASVPDNLVADRLNSAGEALATRIDTDGGNVLLAQGTKITVVMPTKDTVYAEIINIRKRMTLAKVPNDGKRYLLVVPDVFAHILKSPEFIAASALGDEVKQTGAVGRIAGMLVFEWLDETAGLVMIAGHPKFATRVREWSVRIDVNDLKGSGRFIGASAVQGRMVYGHKVLRAAAIIAAYSVTPLTVVLAAGSTKGTTVATVTGTPSGNTLAYRVNPAERAKLGQDGSTDDFTVLTSGTTQITAGAGAIIEVVALDATSKVTTIGYGTAVPKG
ncbi:MAG: hypothetical protein FWF10_08050 [Clostridiales bacterium]|nr:hypothetical protein [Clostridiales bacterium]